MATAANTAALKELSSISKDPQELLDAIQYKLSAARFAHFVRFAWPYVDPVPYVHNWHIEAICDHMQALVEGKTTHRKMMINVPPGHTKTRIVAVMWIAWCWGPGRRPDLRFVCTSFREKLALESSVDCRGLIASEWYQRLWGDCFKVTKDSDSRVNNNKGGYRVALPISGIMGSGGDFVCFEGRTLVATDQGNMPIQKIVEERLTPKIWSVDHNTGKQELASISGYVKSTSSERVKISFADRSFVCTADHQIFVQGQGYIEARSLGPGSELINLQRHGRWDIPITETVTSVDKVKGESAVYCINIAKNRNFFAEGVLVHNCFDDPHNIEQAESDDIRDEKVRKMRLALPTRVRDWTRGGAVCVMQRLHPKDYAGVCLKNEADWEHLCLPALFELDHPTPSRTSLGFIDPRDPACPPDKTYGLKDDERGEGAPLNPKRYSKAKILQLQIDMGGSYATLSQFQQRPAGREGNMFKRSWFKFIDPDEVPAGGEVVRGYDLAGTREDTATAATASCRTRMHKGTLYVEHAELYKKNPGEVEQAVVDRAKSDGRRVAISIPQDPGQAGKYQAQRYLKLLHGYTAEATLEEFSKEARARPLVGQAEAGNVVIVRGPWNDLFLDNLTMFPLEGKDITDAFSRAYKWHVNNRSRSVTIGTARGQF